MLRFNSVLALFICFISINCHAQHLNIWQWQANYFYTNPAFTGISVSPKITADYTRIYPALLPNIRSYEINYDQRISEKAGSIGVNFLYDDPNAFLTRQVAGINYAYTFGLKDELKLRTAASVSYVYLQIDTSKVVSAQKENFTDKSAAYIGLGALLTYKNTFLGVSGFKFTGPLSAKNRNGKTVLVEDISAQAGGFFPINKSNPKSTVIAPSVLLYGYLRNIALAPGIKINKGIVTGGITYYPNYLSAGGLSVLAGISKGWIKAGYTHQFALSDADRIWTGSHELTLTIYPGKMPEGSKEGLPYYFRKIGF